MHQGCNGTIDLPSLPKALKLFSVLNSAFEGSCVLVGMPETLEEMRLSENFFTGTCDLTALPPKLSLLWLDRNKFHGSISLEKLPWTLERLHLEENEFSGTLVFEKVPGNLHKLHLSNNKFSGEISLTEEINCRKIWANGNDFSGTARLIWSTQADLSNTKITRVLDADGKRSWFEPYFLKGEISDGEFEDFM